VNLFAGRIEAVDGTLHHVASPEAGATLAVERDEPLAIGHEVMVAVRPEKIALGAPDAAAAPNRLVGTIESVSYRGEASTYRVALAGGKLVRVTAPNVAHAGGVAVGTRVALAWRADAAMVLEE
jgi:ABC-type Fe3+/spermidine/putrescine transport system ATPase subunit